MRWINRLRTLMRMLRDWARYWFTRLKCAVTGQPSDGDAAILSIMKADWNERARENPMFWIATRPGGWTEADFFESGERDVEQFLSRYQVVVAPGEPVLDVGCGVGRLLRAMLRRGAEGWGIDVSAEMIRQARENLKGENVQLRELSAHQLQDLPKAHFRLVYSFVVLQHIPEASIILACLEQSAGLLRPGGTLLMQVRNDHRHARTYNSYQGATVSVEEVTRALTAGGLSDIEFDGRGTQYMWVKATKAA